MKRVLLAIVFFSICSCASIRDQMKEADAVEDDGGVSWLIRSVGSSAQFALFQTRRISNGLTNCFFQSDELVWKRCRSTCSVPRMSELKSIFSYETLLKKKDAARRLTISIRQLDRLIAAKRIAVVRISSRTVRFKAESIQTFIDQNKWPRPFTTSRRRARVKNNIGLRFPNNN